jgi:ABC-2 type transport system permease protein
MSHHMNQPMINILVRKDLRLVTTPILCYLGAGLLALGLMAIQRQGCFYGGTVLLITALMALGFHPSMITVVGERKEQTLAFVMSLPITPTDFTASKLIANLLAFFVPWTLLLLGCMAVIRLQPSIPDGMMPLAAILFGVVGAGAVMILCVAIVTESMQLTIAIQIASNLLFQVIMYAASNNPVIQAGMRSDTVTWRGPALAYCSAYVLIALLALGVTLWRQARKTSFV